MSTNSGSMRRASVLAAQLARRAGTLAASEQAVTAGCCAAGQLRHFAAGPGPTVVPNPLQQVVPPLLKGIGAAVLLSGSFVPPSDLDLPKWAAWLAANGYRNKQGWDTLMAGIKAAAPSLEPSDVEALVPALHAVGRFDRELFGQFADIVKALWDDVADSITYCNHYMAPSRIPLADVAALFSAYAKYEVDRGDMFVALARTIHEDRLKGLGDDELREVLGGLLGAFKALAFYPDCTQALLVAGRLRASAMGPAENALMADVESALRDHAPEGKLPWLDGGFKDWEHFHGTGFGSYNLWVARDELTPQYYKPSDISPRPASMTSAPPEPTGAASSS
ncbi:hypothetical protein COO60DRAFT_1463078 [Scenedesmus sp. NREL 46B-D3]|nr:hypothetical protein COO60DRAFT_1463078 [Scenedesmus sp. NREL 46B-D3]